MQFRRACRSRPLERATELTIDTRAVCVCVFIMPLLKYTLTVPMFYTVVCDLCSLYNVQTNPPDVQECQRILRLFHVTTREYFRLLW